MDEIWKEAIGYEGFYEVSSKGGVRSLDRLDSMGRAWKGKRLKAKPNSHGYPAVSLYKPGGRRVVEVHRLVAKSFLTAENTAHQVNHINGIKTDNRVVNLEWCTASQNQQHSRHILGNKGHPRRPVIAQGKVVSIYFPSVTSASDHGYNVRNIYACISERYKRNTYAGFNWKYA